MSLKVIIIFAAAVGVILAESSYGPPRNTYQAPAAAPSRSYGAPSGSNGPTAPPMYDFEYAVDDRPSRNDFGHEESRDGDDTEGEYFVQLPDGRLQKVTYTVNGDSGFVAEVTYEGEAQYPQQSSSSGYGNNGNSKPKSSGYA